MIGDYFDFQSLVPTFGAEQPAPRYRLGTVSQVNSNQTIDVTVASSATVLTNIKYLGNVQPLPGAPIWLVSDGYDMYAFGVMAATNRTFAPRAYRSTDQNTTDSTDTTVTFNSVASDEWASWDSSQRLYARMTGRYIAIGALAFAANGTGFRQAWIQRTGTVFGRVHQIAAAAGSPTHMSMTTPAFDMTAGVDYVTLHASQNSGGTLAVQSIGTYTPSLTLVYLGP